MEDSAGATVLVWAAIVFLVSLSALFAGLTLGIMSLDITGLEIVIASGSEKESAYAKKIYPIRSRGNLLLCTLLLGNVSVNALLSILMADLTTGLIGFLLSTFIIVVFGEIVPQAACSRHGLAVGAHTAWIVYIFLFIFFPFSFPIASALDWWLGQEMGTIYTRNELKKLLDIHAVHREESGVSSKDVMILSGVLDYASKKVEQIMTPIDSVFMLDIESKLDMNVLTNILERGHSRIPIYEGDRDNIVSCILVKDLAIVNPEEGLSLRSFLNFYGRQLPKLKHDMTLDFVLTEFKTGKSHMGVVVKPPALASSIEGEIRELTIGVVTLEDVLEEILQDEIMDENDVNRQRRSTEESGYKKYASFKKPGHANLSPQQMVAVTSFLAKTLPEFSKKLLSDEAFKYLLRNSTILEFDRPPKGDKVIYTRGLPDQFFTLVLQGKLEIRSGSEGFYSECGPFSYLGLDALKFEAFVPDFTAKVVSHVQLLRIKKKTYDNSIQMIQLQLPAQTPRKVAVKPLVSLGTPEKFTDSVDFVERNTMISPVKKDVAIAMKSFTSKKNVNPLPTTTGGKPKEEKMSLIDYIEEEGEEESESDTFTTGTNLEAEERLRRLVKSSGDGIMTSSTTTTTSNNENTTTFGPNSGLGLGLGLGPSIRESGGRPRRASDASLPKRDYLA